MRYKHIDQGNNANNHNVEHVGLKKSFRVIQTSSSVQNSGGDRGLRRQCYPKVMASYVM